MRSRVIRVVSERYNANALDLISSGGGVQRTKNITKATVIGIGIGFGYSMVVGKGVLFSMVVGGICGAGVGTLYENYRNK